MSHYLFDIHPLAEAIKYSYENETKLKITFVGIPLRDAGNIFKTLCSHIIGFEWLIQLSLKLKTLPYVKWTLPAIQYLADYSHYVQRYEGNRAVGRPYETPPISGFAVGERTYYVSPVNFLLVPINYLARTIGKMVGWAIVSPIVILAYLAITAYYNFKRMIAKIKINFHLKEMSHIHLALHWFRNKSMPTQKIAEHITTNEAFAGLLKEYGDTLSLYIKDELSIDPIRTSIYGEYIETRREVLNTKCQSKRRWSLALTILSGLLLFPLFFTIPAHKKRMQHANAETNEELAMMDKNKIIIMRLHRLYDDNRNRNNPDFIYQHGQLLLEEGQANLAYYYFSKVPQSCEHYKEAMQECGLFLLARGHNQKAANYFQKAGDNQVANIAARLVQNPDADPSVITNVNIVQPAAELKGNSILENQAQSTFVSQGKNLHSLGTFSHNPRTSQIKDNIKSLDDEEDDDLSSSPTDKKGSNALMSNKQI